MSYHEQKNFDKFRRFLGGEAAGGIPSVFSLSGPRFPCEPAMQCLSCLRPTPLAIPVGRPVESVWASRRRKGWSQHDMSRLIAKQLGGVVVGAIVAEVMLPPVRVRLAPQTDGAVQVHVQHGNDGVKAPRKQLDTKAARKPASKI